MVCESRDEARDEGMAGDRGEDGPLGLDVLDLLETNDFIGWE